MLVVNTSSQATIIELQFYRLHIPSGERSVESVTISLDIGPELIKRARVALSVHLDLLNAISGQWKYWTKS